MKKITKCIGVCSLLVSAALLSGCTNPATADTGSNGGGGSSTTNTVLWSTFEGADLQIWGNTFTAESSDTDGLVVTVGSAGWWGGCFCNDGTVGAATSGVITFDMSKVATITFYAKASAAGSFWVSQSNAAAVVTNQQAESLTTDWQKYTYTCSGTGSTDYGVLDIGGGDLSTTTTAGYKIYIKDIAFQNSSGTEIVPTRSE